MLQKLVAQMRERERESKRLRRFVKFLFVVFSIFLFSFKNSAVVFASSSFSDSFTDQTKISQTARISVDTTAHQVTLQSGSNTLADDKTLLLSHLGSDIDITTPAIAGGTGGTATGITYTTGTGGHSGEAAIINGNGHYISFPVSGNFNPLKGSIDFWLSFSDWSLTAGKTPEYPYEEMIFYVADGNKSFSLLREWNGKVQLRITDASGGVYSRNLTAYGFDAGSWHHFTFTWNIEEDTFYINCSIDDAFTDKNELMDASPNTWDVAVFSSFNPTTFYIGNRSDGLRPLNGKIDELRITSTEYALTNYPGKAGILTSASFDTGVASPVFGKIKWNESLASKTDIELQTSVSDNGSTWTNWFSENKGMITITFDDDYSSVYDTAYPIMTSYGFKGVPYIVTSWVGTANYMTIAQLLTLQTAGWEIASHTVSHNTSTLAQFADSRQWLIDNGLNHDAFAYPGGSFTQTIIDQVADYYTTARTTQEQYQTFNGKYRLYTYAGNYAVSEVNSFVDSVVNKKAWGILMFHAVGQTGASVNTSIADFTSMMQHLNDSGLTVATMAGALTNLAMYTNNSGDQILAANKRYIKYRAIFYSYNGTNTPTLISLTISAPTKIYKNIATTINSDGTFDHATWPQTTDTSIDSLTVTPNTGSVTVNVDTWNTSGTYYKKWTETASTSNVTTNHTIGDLVAGSYYNVKKNSSIWNTYQANGSGQITFNYTEGYSTITFEVEQDKTAPTISAVSSTPTSTGSTITWTTNEDSSSKVDYGLTNSYGSTTTETDTTTRVQNHSVALSGLSSCTTYHYRVRSIDTALNETIDSDNTFVTTGCTNSSTSSSNNSSSTSTTVCSDTTPGTKAPLLYGAIAQDSGSILLYFTEADNPVNKYVLEYGTKSGDYPYGVQDMGINLRGQMTYLVKSLSPNTTYYFKVRGGNGCATGSWSNEISSKTKGIVSFNQLEITQSQLEPQPVTETPSDTSCQTYTVKSGDSLWSIAQNLLGDGNRYKEIVEQNKETYSSLETSNNLRSGWELKINCGKQAVTEEKKKSTETQGGYDVKVKVVDTNKKPIEGASVTLHSIPQTAKTNNAGIAEFKNVEAGDHKVLIAYNNFEGEQSINLTGDVKEFDLNVTVQQKTISLSPLAYGIIGIMGLVIIGLIVLLIKNKRKE